MKFVCKNCNYRFESEETGDLKEKKCPYCGERKIIKEPSANELINEIEVE